LAEELIVAFEDRVGVAGAGVGVVRIYDVEVDRFPFNDNPPFGEIDLFADLGIDIPTGTFEGRRNEFGANIPFGEGFLIDAVIVEGDCLGL
jgi:hypothetical protein